MYYTIDDPIGWSKIVQAGSAGLLSSVILTSALEFVCAQSPLNMRSLSIGYIWSMVYLTYGISGIYSSVYLTICVLLHTVQLSTIH